MSDLKDDIEKYLRGDLTAAEMHLLEKKALSDPFLAEALEGGSLLHPEDFSKDMEDLKRSIHKRVERKTIPLWLWSARIAAGLIILVITGYLVSNLINKNAAKSNLALNKNESSAVEPNPPVEETPVQDSPPVKTPKNDAEVSKPKLTRSRHSESMAEEGADNVSSFSNDENLPPGIQKDAIAQNELVEKRATAGEAEIKQDVEYKITEDAPVQLADKFKEEKEGPKKKANSVASNSPAGVAFRKSLGKKELKVLQGKVIDEDGSPMPGVSVALKGSETGTMTDEEGKYKLSLDADSTRELVFSFIGMQRTEVPITNKDSINAKLTPDFAELSEVVVVGYGSVNDDEDKAENISVYQPASPDGGKKAYKKYLVENLRYPEQAIESKVQGKVTVQFVIESNGNLDDFRVLKGIGHGCDGEVIRLIKQGPKWIPTKRNDVPTKGRVKVRLKFTLPD